jgi:hypothetical protein
LDRAFAEDRVLVTKNVADFLKLSRAREIHAGIVVLEDGGLARAGRLDAIRRAYRFARQQADMVNRVVRVAADGTMTT